VTARESSGAPEKWGYVLSVLLHVIVGAAAFLLLRSTASTVPLPPQYHVELVAAPPGERAIGEVRSTPPTPNQPTTATRPSDASVKTMPTPKATPVDNPARRATPDQAIPKKQVKSNAPIAGGGPIGGRGTDVATVRAEGIEFPFPGYLNNVVRQIALNFKPRNRNSGLKATVRFLIHRDGTVTDFTFIQKSGDYGFDLEARSAVDAASRTRAFGPLPSGYRDDVLPVTFDFSPTFLQ
jgi:protein TonB